MWFCVASSSVGQKSNHFVPKKKKSKDPNAAVLKRKRSDSKGRSNGSSRPPLKPNLKTSSKGVNKPAQTPKPSQKNGSERRQSINTNPFKPPKAPKQSKLEEDKESIQSDTTELATTDVDNYNDDTKSDLNQSTADINNNNDDVKDELDGSKATITSKY